MKKPRFRLGTIFWLVTTCALLLGWYKDHRQQVAEQQQLAREIVELEWDNAVLAGFAREGVTGVGGFTPMPRELDGMRTAAVARAKHRLVVQGISREYVEREAQWVTEYLRSYYEHRRRIEAKESADESAGAAREAELDDGSETVSGIDAARCVN